MNTALHAPQPAQILDGYVKMRFLPMLFAGDFMCAELNIYQYADRFLSDYDGGVWEYAQLPGGGFMKPEGEARWHFSNPVNYSELDVSAEAAGIIITALVLNHRSWMYDRHDEYAIFRALDGLITRAALPPHHAMRAVDEGDSTSGSGPV